MKTELFYFDDCPSYEQAEANLKEALRLEGLSEAVEMLQVSSEEDARQKRFIGSPTIRIDGIDIEGPEAEKKGYGYGCRVYSSDGGFAGWPSVEQIRSALRRRNRAEIPRTSRLFDLELQYRPEAEPVTSADGRDGTRLGGGDGWVEGSAIRGSVRWDIYEKTGSSSCEFSLVGFLDTEEGPVAFDARGFGAIPDPANKNRWSMVSAARFTTSSSSKPHADLAKTVAALVGQFDMETGRHYYRAVTTGADLPAAANEVPPEPAHSSCS